MLPGKLAFVTGAGGGIGRAICRVMAREGATVVAADLNINNVQTTVDELTGEGHKSYQLDVSDAESVTSVLKQVLTDYSAPPTVVVNAAGITRDNFMLKMSVQDFESVFNINVKGTFLITQTICRELVEKNLSGSIVNIGSIVAQRGNIGQCNYSASKAAVEVFSKTVALEMAKFNIRCNTVLPGFTITPMTDMIPENIREHFKSAIPLKRFASSEEPHKPKIISQCQNCQAYGHTKAYCGYMPRCVRCGNNHHSSACPNSRQDPMRCALCSGNHPANYKGCSTYKELQLQIAEVVTFLASEKSSYVTGTSIPVSGGY